MLVEPDLDQATPAAALQLGRVLAELGLPVPRPRATRAGAWWCWLDGLQVAVFEFVDGKPLNDQDLSAAGLG